MDTLFSMRIFRQVVECGSFTAAGAALDLSVAMVSKHVRHLEEHVGTRLLNRTSRRVSLNAAGSVYYDRCCELLNGLDEAENEIRCTLHRAQGTLRVTAPSWFGSSTFAWMLTEYRKQHPLVKLDVLLSDDFVDLVEQGIDVALRVTGSLETRLPARKLVEMEFVLAASREYLAERGRPQRVEDVAEHEVVAYAYDPGSYWPFALAPPNFRCNNTTLIAHLVAHQAGLAVLPRLLVEHESAWAERFEMVLPELKLPRPTLYAVTQDRRHLPARVSTFLDHLAVCFAGSACPGA